MKEQDFNNIFAKNLMRYMEKRDISQADLAKRLCVSSTSVSNWCNAIKTPRMGNVDKICSILGVTRIELMSAESEATIVNRGTVQVSIITDVNHNGIPDQLEEGANYPTLTIPEEFLSEQCDAKHVFIFRISVPSSERLLPPGRSYVIVRTNITLDCFENGDFALFEKCENQYVVKRVYFSGDNIVIRPFIDHLNYVEYIDHVICADEFYKRIKGKVIGHFVIDE